ncbi:unnamed protein product [Acanthoscelides obtectus]|uniref:ubiquitinyl hydrolase 1 n=2 Tax=Acanthoscelides obtectus TaxID=200917 RepID=A0A9P0JL67_ACAOB|nr:unnamed protein product [Acanthoscelides obtectus]CAK1628879.1 Ubiquitin carboxyl-terminal hydrolase 2 [Acanthoscelides obtectus]
MMDEKVIPLYITDSLAGLDALATKDHVLKYLNKSPKLKHVGSKMKKELLLCREDQERSYILAKRYVLLMDHLFKVSDDPKYIRTLFLNDYNTVKTLLNSLRSELEERYGITVVLQEKLSISLRAPHSSNTLSDESSIVLDSDYIQPTGEPDPFKDFEPIEDDMATYIQEPRGAPLVQHPESGLFLTPEEFYKRLDDMNVLIVDVRQAYEYDQTRIKKKAGGMINIPPKLIQPGLSANTLGLKLPRETHVIWDNRDSFDCIVMLDYDTTKFTFGLSKLHCLRIFITEWDFNRSYRELPFILDGGLKEFVQCYPSEVENSGCLFAKQNSEIDDLLDIDSVEYPGAASGEGHRNLRVDSAYSMGNVAKRVERDFPEEDEDDDVALKLRNIRSEGALPKHSYFAKEPGVSSGPYTSISEHQITMEYNEGNINTAASTDFIKPQDMSVEDCQAMRKLMEGDREMLLRKARASKPTYLPEQRNEGNQDYSRSPERRRDNSPEPMDNAVPTYVPPPPSFDRSFKPDKVKEPEKDVNGRGFTGIQNYKNCCFMSAILQCMKTLPFIKEYYVNTNRYLTLNRRVPPVFNMLMGEVFEKLWEGSEDDPKIYYPKFIRDKLSRVNPMYEKCWHEDAFEFFTFFFAQLSEDCMVEMPRPEVMTDSEQAWYSALQGRSSFLVDRTYYQLRDEKICTHCKKKMWSFETEGTLNLAMRQNLEPCELEDLINNYLAETTEKDYQCEICKNIGAVVNKRSVVVDPDTLIICLKRILVSKDEVMKHPGLVSFPHKLQFGSSVYQLYAVVQHSGTLSQGHYIATVLLDDVRDDWIEFNDDVMTRISTRPLKDALGIRSSVAGFFYVRQYAAEPNVV